MPLPSAFGLRRPFRRERRRGLGEESALPSASSRTRGGRGIAPVAGDGGCLADSSQPEAKARCDATSRPPMLSGSARIREHLGS
jgi:hypothetical protein